MPSRNTLHGMGVGFESRIRGKRLVGRFGALAAEWLRFRHRAGPGMRVKMVRFDFVVFLEHVFFVCQN